MTSQLERFKAKALKKPGVRGAYEELADEFALLGEFLRVRAEAGLTQAEVAQRAGTTQSAIARLESGVPKHSPSIVTLQKYARAVGCRVEIRLVKEEARSQKRSRSLKPTEAGRR